MNKRFKIALCILLAVVLVVAICILSGPKKVKVGVLAGTPMAYKNSDGVWTGFDIEFANKMFAEIGRVPEFVEVTATTRKKMLKKGEIDCYMSGTESSVGEFIHSEGYISAKQVVFHKNIEGIEVNSLYDLKNYRVGVLNNSKNEKTLSEYTQPINILEHSTNKEIINMLDASDIDVALIDYMYAEALVQNNAEHSTDVVGIIYDTCEHTVMFNQKNKKLCENVSEKIREYKEQGYFEMLKNEYSMEKYYQ